MFLYQSLMHRTLSKVIGMRYKTKHDTLCLCGGIWGASTCSLIHSFPTFLVKALEDSTDTFSGLQLLHAHSFTLPQSFDRDCCCHHVHLETLGVDDPPLPPGLCYLMMTSLCVAGRMVDIQHAPVHPWDPETRTPSWHCTIVWLHPLLSPASLLSEQFLPGTCPQYKSYFWFRVCFWENTI